MANLMTPAKTLVIGLFMAYTVDTHEKGNIEKSCLFFVMIAITKRRWQRHVVGDKKSIWKRTGDEKKVFFSLKHIFLTDSSRMAYFRITTTNPECILIPLLQNIL